MLGSMQQCLVLYLTVCMGNVGREGNGSHLASSLHRRMNTLNTTDYRAVQTLSSLSADFSIRTPTDYKLLAVYLLIIFDISTETIY